MRELFTQTIALRLASSSETRMVLGDGYGDLAPAHRIDRTMPGAGYVVRDDGVVERVRADFWPDDVIRTVSERYPAPTAPVDWYENRAPVGLVSVVTPDMDTAPLPRRRSPRSSSGPEDSEVA